MSDDQDSAVKPEENTSNQTSPDSTSSTTESSTTTTNEQQEPQVTKPAPSKPAVSTPRPTVGTPVARPTIGTPIGTPVVKPVSQAPSVPAATPAVTPAAKPVATGTAASRPAVGTPVGSRPNVVTPVGSRPIPAVGTPEAGASRPGISSPATARPATPAKKPESREEISRRRFIRGLAALGGIVAVVQFGALGPFLQGSVGSQDPLYSSGSQKIVNSVTGNPITNTSFSDAVQWQTFVYPKTNNSNIDSDTFRQCVIIKLPSGFTAPASLSASDSTGTYCGFSRVCVHLWCLWSYVPTDMRMECPCHGSQYVPGSGTYPLLPGADNKPPGLAVEGPASLQTPPNNQLPMVLLKINSDGTFSATGFVGVVGCGQDC